MSPPGPTAGGLRRHPESSPQVNYSLPTCDPATSPVGSSLDGPDPSLVTWPETPEANTSGGIERQRSEGEGRGERAAAPATASAFEDQNVRASRWALIADSGAAASPPVR
ncbi:hypothetical protein SEVIR_3G380450v4 [Setaria viridis]